MQDQSIEDLQLSQIASRTVRGLTALISRSVIIQLISLAGFFFLSLYLDRAEIGIFFAVSEIVGILGYFSDVGLAAALIQSKATPTVNAIRTSFTLQQALVFTLSAILWFCIPLLANFYQLSDSAIFLLKSLIIAFILSSLKTIPTVLLERQLRFEKLVIVESLETIVFYGSAVYLAYRGFGTLSYAYAVLLRGLVGVIAINILSPWPFGLAFSKSELRHLLHFGLPYQGNTFIAAIKDRLLNVILLKFVGGDGMGILGWAQTWSQKPLRFISDNVTKVTFPAFSRMQDHPESLVPATNQMLFFTALAIFPLLVGMGVTIEPIIELIPRYQKWQPAVATFYIYLWSAGWAAISTPLTNLLAAVGHIRTVSKLMVMWTILTWGIIAPLAFVYGFQGAAWGTGILAAFSAIPIYLAHKVVPFQITKIFPALFASLIMGCVVFLITQLTPINWLNLSIAILIGIFTYILLIWLFAPNQAIQGLKYLKLFSKKHEL